VGWQEVKPLKEMVVPQFEFKLRHYPGLEQFFVGSVAGGKFNFQFVNALLFEGVFGSFRCGHPAKDFILAGFALLREKACQFRLDVFFHTIL
jgi:hypothetical protein